MGLSTGGGQLFGATGGVMEAALRTAYEAYTGKTLENIDFKDVRGLTGIKESNIDLGDGVILKVAVAHTLRNAQKVIEKVKAGEADYHFVEVMACPGGCIGGGGQPYPTDEDVRLDRIGAIYDADAKMKYRKSHENPARRLWELELRGGLDGRDLGGAHAHEAEVR